MISVVIPVFNAENTITAALESVQNQRGAFISEIIVVDDGSTDNSAGVVTNYATTHPDLQVILLQQQNKGVSAARNAGMSAARNDFIALLDADDVWLPEKTSEQMRFLLDPKCVLDFISCERNGDRVRFPYRADDDGVANVTFLKLLIRNGIPNTSIFRKEILTDTGFFDENMRHAEDLDFYLRVSTSHKMAVLDKSLVITGQGKKPFGVSGLSANLRKMEKGFQYTLKKLRNMGYLNSAAYQIAKTYFRLKYIIRILRR